jgi:uncharacterized RDD family membrane protein YckC
LKEGPRQTDAAYRQVPIDFQFQSRKEEPAKPRNVDWRAELRRKLSERSAALASAKGERQPAAPAETAKRPVAKEADVPPPSGPRKVFHPLAQPDGPIKGRLEHPAAPKVLFPGGGAAHSGPGEEKRPASPPTATGLESARKAPGSGSRLDRKDPNLILERPLVRTQPKNRPSAPAVPEQRKLVLEFEASAEPEDDEVSAPAREEEESRVSAEVLFSRVLAGIIDLLLPVLQSFVFTVTGSRVLGFELFSASALTWIAYLFFGFYLFNSLFFLLLSGMTPGMYLTEIRLRGSDSEGYSAVAVVVRVLLYLPVLVTVVGLLTALVDNRRRCLHDLVSGTQVVPQPEEESDSPSSL